jgi:LPXTG-site transpeptidase (sortase) family protein
LLAILCPLVAGGVLPAHADTANGTPLYFRETGHTLAYNFRLFWDRNGGLPIFGYPITEVFMEDGWPVQYFERARLEWHADIGWVLAGHLGRWAAERSGADPAFAPRDGVAYPGQVYFPESRHTLGGLFRKYQVSLGHLGRQYLNATNTAPAWAFGTVKSADSAWYAVRPTRITMPRIGLDTDVVEAGFSLGEWDVPRYTAAHYWPIAGYPGSPGNIVIAGHVGYRDTIFNYLPRAAVGDELFLTVNGADRRYVVDQVLTLLPTETWVMGPTSDEAVTLITCVPIGVYSHRLIVRAKPKP